MRGRPWLRAVRCAALQSFSLKACCNCAAMQRSCSAVQRTRPDPGLYFPLLRNSDFPNLDVFSPSFNSLISGFPKISKASCGNHDLSMVIRNLLMWKPAETVFGSPFLSVQVKACRVENHSSRTKSLFFCISKRAWCHRYSLFSDFSCGSHQIRSLHGKSRCEDSSTCALYETLGVSPKASTKEIKSAFIRKSKELHPDRNPGLKTSHKEFTRVNEAYRILRVPHLRREYDIRLNSHAHQEPTVGEEFLKKSASTSHVNFRYNPYKDNVFAKSSARPTTGHPNYYGIKGWRRVRNRTIIIYCLCFLFLGVGLHFGAYRTSTFLTKIDMDMVQQVNIDRYNKIRQRARDTLTSPNDHRYVQSVMENLRADAEDSGQRQVDNEPQDK